MTRAYRYFLPLFALFCLANCSENATQAKREIKNGTIIEGYVYNGGAVSNSMNWEGTKELETKLRRDGNKIGVVWVSPITGQKSVSVGSGWRKLESKDSLASASQRGSILLMLDSTIKAARDMAELEAKGGNPLTRRGFSDRAQYAELIRDYRSGISAIHSSGNITKKASDEIIETTLPNSLDSPATIQRKADKRSRLLNAAAQTVGRQPPFVRASFMEKIEAEAAAQLRQSP